MRNLIEYPLQPHEVIEALDWAIAECEKSKVVGSLHGVALFWMRDLMIARPFVAEDVCARAKIDAS